MVQLVAYRQLQVVETLKTDFYRVRLVRQLVGLVVRVQLVEIYFGIR